MLDASVILFRYYDDMAMHFEMSLSISRFFQSKPFAAASALSHSPRRSQPLSHQLDHRDLCFAHLLYFHSRSFFNGVDFRH